MKRARASDREASKGPNLKNKENAKGTKKRKATEQQKQELSGESSTKQSRVKKRKATGSSSVSKKVKNKENWSVMSTSSIIAMEHIIDLSILNTLALKRTEKKESQEHLNIMKKRFLAQCSQLKVPAQKKKDLDYSSHHHQEETRKSVAGQETLARVKEDLKAVVCALEDVEEKTVSLQHECSALRDQVEEEEERNEESLHIMKQATLSLPPQLPQNDNTKVETWLTKIIPDGDIEITAQKLGKILQDSEAVQEAKMLLLHTHRHVDQLFNPESNQITDPSHSEGT